MGPIITEIPRLHTAIAEWMACMIFIRILKKKIFFSTTHSEW